MKSICKDFFKSLNKFEKVTIIIVLTWFLLQIIVVALFWDYPQYPDAHHYMDEATSHLAVGETYPSMMDLYDRYIQSPMTANYMMLLLGVFGTFKAGIIINILLNCGILWLMFLIAKRFFSKKVACIAVIISCLLPTNLFIPIHLLSELPFLFCCMSAFLLGLSKKYWKLILSGFLFMIAYAFRPQMMGFLVPLFLIMLINRRRIWHYVAIIVPFALLYFSYGEYNKTQTGYFLVHSTTGGLCLDGVANDYYKTNRAVYHALYEGDTLLVVGGVEKRFDELTFHEKDSVMRAGAKRWIKQNAISYIEGVVYRMGYLFVYDYWAYPLQDHISLDMRQYVVKESRTVYILLSIPYCILLLLSFVSIVKNRSDIYTEKGLLLLIMLFFIGGGALVYVESRFHYPFMWIMCIWGAYGINSYRQNKAGEL